MATSLKDRRYNSILIEGMIPQDDFDCTSLWRSLGLETYGRGDGPGGSLAPNVVVKERHTS
jgi:hypothetical protein